MILNTRNTCIWVKSTGFDEAEWLAVFVFYIPPNSYGHFERVPKQNPSRKTEEAWDQSLYPLSQLFKIICNDIVS